MSDILQELREPIPKVEGYSGEYVDEDAVLSIFKDAADEIERLRAEVEWHEEENSKLRKLLHDAMGIIWCWEPTSQSGKELKQKLSDDISAALGEKE